MRVLLRVYAHASCIHAKCAGPPQAALCVTPLPCHAVNLNDLHMYDPATRVWTSLSANVSGTPPSPRAYHGFASADGKLYVFGGSGDQRGRAAGPRNCADQRGEGSRGRETSGAPGMRVQGSAACNYCPMHPSINAWMHCQKDGGLVSTQARLCFGYKAGSLSPDSGSL